MATLAEVHRNLSVGYENRAFEVKGPGSLSDKEYCAKVGRAVMAMGNIRDGGLVCLGIEDTRIAEMQPGLTDEQSKEWAHSDNVIDKMATYCDPPVALTVHPYTVSSGISVVVLEAAEFTHTPHVCKRDHGKILSRGQVYVRPRGKPQSVPVPTATDMRELLDLATEKGVRDFLHRAESVGLIQQGEAHLTASGDKHFDMEAARAWSEPSMILQGLTALGHMDVAIRPYPFIPERLNPARLERFVGEHTVRLRGWPVPYVDHNQHIRHHGSWIGQDVPKRVTPHLESWRMCASGQFLHRRVLATDLRDVEDLRPSSSDTTGAVAVWDVLLYMSEVAELSARMIASLDTDSVTLHVSLNQISGRELISGDYRRELHGPYITMADRLTYSTMVESTALMSFTERVGIELTQGILRQFGLDVPDQTLVDWKDQILRR